MTSAGRLMVSLKLCRTGVPQHGQLPDILWRVAGAGLAAVVYLPGVLDTPLQVRAPP